MKKYLDLFQLYSLWFFILNAVVITLFYFTHQPAMAIVIKFFSYPVILFINQPFTKRYHFYFNNLGFRPIRMFIWICLVDLVLFVLALTLYQFIPDAGNR